MRPLLAGLNNGIGIDLVEVYENSRWISPAGAPFSCQARLLYVAV